MHTIILNLKKILPQIPHNMVSIEMMTETFTYGAMYPFKYKPRSLVCNCNLFEASKIIQVTKYGVLSSEKLLLFIIRLPNKKSMITVTICTAVKLNIHRNKQACLLHVCSCLFFSVF